MTEGPYDEVDPEIVVRFPLEGAYYAPRFEEINVETIVAQREDGRIFFGRVAETVQDTPTNPYGEA